MAVAAAEAASSTTLLVRSRVPTVKDLTMGGAPLGCLFKDVPSEQAVETVKAALEAGVEFFDTAPFYGAGVSEERFAAALPASGVTISTKTGRIVKDKAEIRPSDKVDALYVKEYFTQAYHDRLIVLDYTAEGVRESVRQSCERLRRTTLDALYIHDAGDEERFAAATAPGGAVDAMIQLRSEGKVKRLGIGMAEQGFLLRFLRSHPPGTFDEVMMASSWNLLDTSGLEALRECQGLGVRVIIAGVFAAGFLWGGPYYRYSSSVPSEIIDKADRWKALAAKHCIELPRLALHFALLPEVVVRCAFGCTSPSEVAANVSLCSKDPVPVEIWAEAKDLGLLPADLPIPS